MKTLFSLFFGALLLCVTSLLTATAQNPKPFVIPELRQWNGSTGFFTPDKNTRLFISPQAPKLAIQALHSLSEDAQKMLGLPFEVIHDNQKDGDIIFSVIPINNKNKEAYSIEIQPAKVVISANTSTGILWSTKTLLQIMEQSEKRVIPCGSIEDYPQYKMRGFMLDVGRKFFSMEYLEQCVKMLSYYKMNTFQIHLNDNGFYDLFERDWNKTYAAFRLESTTFPELTAKDGFYTKAAFRKLQQQALSAGVTIIPEIDAPAHTLAFSHYLPEIGSKEYGMDHLDLFNPKTYEFMDKLLKEYLEGDDPIFVNSYVHIGTDEYSNKDKEVVEKFRYFTDRYIRYVESFGKKAMVWGALTHAKGDTPVKVDSVLMACWYNGYADPKEMIEKGYNVISIPDGLVYIVPGAGYYHDYLNTEHLYNKWIPSHIGKEVFDENHPQIQGGMFAVWNDHCGNGITFQDVQHRLFPAVQTLAVKFWNGSAVKLPYEEFNKKRLLISEAPGVNILARYPQLKSKVIFTAKTLKPNSTTTVNEIGFGYNAEFTVNLKTVKKGDVLFKSDNTTFYAADPKTGKVGFERDGYLCTFNYNIPTKTQQKIRIEGSNYSTKLFVNDRLIEDLTPDKLQREKVNGTHHTVKFYQTLVFPMAQTGNFDGKLTDVKVTVE